jgi:hypothetical protein
MLSRPGGGGGGWAAMNQAMAENRAERLTWHGGKSEASQKVLLSAPEDETAGSGTSIFDPVLCELAYRWFCPPKGLVLDPLAERRLMVLETLDPSRAKLDMRAEYPLGVCRARLLILEVEHLAGLEFERRHNGQLERAKTPPSCLRESMPSGEGSVSGGLPDPADEAKDELKYLAARDVLKAAGTRAWGNVQNIVINHRWPRFLDTERQRPVAAWLSDERDVAAFPLAA